MKKKLVAITLVAALSVSAMATAFAAVPNADSNAGILFHWGGGDGIVDPPVDPPTEDWHYWGDALGLDFGDNPVTQLQRTYSSLTAARFRNAAGEVSPAGVLPSQFPQDTADNFRDFPPRESLSPDELLRRAGESFTAGNIAAAIALLDQYRADFPFMVTDELYWLYGQFYEANSSSRDILLALDFYRRLIREFPQSTRFNDARRRIAYLERFFININ